MYRRVLKNTIVRERSYKDRNNDLENLIEYYVASFYGFCFPSLLCSPYWLRLQKNLARLGSLAN